MNPTTHSLTELCFSICLDACIYWKILGKNSDDKRANNALKEAMHGKLLPALQACLTRELGLIITPSEGEVSLVITEQGTGIFCLGGCAEHFWCSLGIYMYVHIKFLFSAALPRWSHMKWIIDKVWFMILTFSLQAFCMLGYLQPVLISGDNIFSTLTLDYQLPAGRTA